MLAGIVTLVAMAAFVGGVAWALSGKRKREFDEAAQLPLDDEDAPAAKDKDGNKQ
jgi:cytochrome c oxidase cbb3-type subunit 4